MSLCYINGEFLPIEKATLPVTDFIILRGVGVFESISTFRKRPLMLTPHLERLLRSAASASLALPLPGEDIKSLVLEGISRMTEDCLVRPYITGGDVFLSGAFPASRLFILFEKINKPAPEVYADGVLLMPVDGGRHIPGIKNIDYMFSYTGFAKRGDAYEILYCPDGEITEAAHSSFFLYTGGRLVTAPLSRVLKGTMRDIILQLAAEKGMKIEERCPLLSELSTAEEAFITGSVKEVVPVVKIGDQVIGSGRPGAVTRMLHHTLLEEIVRWLE
ncbi:MAG: aminotransferase class IV [Synergistota bacterium]|jgi:branched-chain amino acid aminotransferase|nr:aminotransferase class IV [Synergistota bacterium]OPZ39864.1 MAG: Branched-chain-amino-acid aminotransferase [Synergistetes bacterium ADurb.BinA166]